MRLPNGPVLIIYAITVLFSLAIPLVHSQVDNAEVTRTRNQQYFLLQPNNVDVTRCRNLQYSKLAANPADVIRFRNLQYFELAPNNADVVRYRNLMYFQLEPNNADVKRYRNLQHFRLEFLLYEYRVNITRLLITDQANNPSTNFLKGEVVQFNFTIANTGGAEHLPLDNGLISTVILDPSETQIFLSYSFDDIPKGTSKNYIVGYGIPPDGTVGTYTVNVMVFTKWPSEEGIGLDIRTETFVVS